MSKFTILGSLDADQIPAALPPDYRDRSRIAAKRGSRYTVVLFDHDRSGGVVTSATVRRALTRVPTVDPLLAVGNDFTSEATALLDARHALVIRIGEFGWTDESYHSLPR